MRNNDIGLLRSLIREMVNEAPYRASPVVTLRSVQGTGISLGAAALATGIGAIASAYTWLNERCDGQHSNFPIRLSNKAKDALIDTGKRTASLKLDQHVALWRAYQDTIAEGGVASKADSTITINTTNSDRAANYELYGLATKPLGSWTKPKATWDDIDPTARREVVQKMVALMTLYTGCDAAFIHGLLGNVVNDAKGDADRRAKFPFKSRDSLKQFLIDLVNDANGSFKNSVIDQRNQLLVIFNSQNDKALITKICDAAYTGDVRDKNSFIKQIQ